MTVRPGVITSCCGALFSEGDGSVTSELAGLPVKAAMALFYGSAGAEAGLPARCYEGKRHFTSGSGSERGTAVTPGRVVGDWRMVVVLLLFSLPFLRGSTYGGEGSAPSPGDRCPVCGMFVSKYPDWVSTITYEDGSSVFFDGAKDMFKYYFNSGKYNAYKNSENIVSIYVTDYYSMEMVPAGTVNFVLGSDVIGPMGEELIPVRGEGEVREFIRDHGGRPVPFDDITADLVP